MNRREAIKLAREKCQDTPSAEAIALAVKLSGHTHCQRALATQSGTPYKPEHFVCDGCLGDAAVIDAELKLKERNAVVQLAKALSDAGPIADMDNVREQLRDALKAI